MAPLGLSPGPLQKRVKEQGVTGWEGEMGSHKWAWAAEWWGAVFETRHVCCVTARATQTRTSKLPVPPRASTWNFHDVLTLALYRSSATLLGIVVLRSLLHSG